MARKRKELGPGVDAQIRQLAARGHTAEAIAARLTAAGIGGVSVRTVGRRMQEARGSVAPPRATKHAPSVPPRPAPVPAAVAPEPPPAGEAPAAPPAPADGPATAKDRQVDELIARSLTWRRVEAAIAGALAPYPEAAAAVVRALRSVNL